MAKIKTRHKSKPFKKDIIDKLVSFTKLYFNFNLLLDPLKL